MLGFKNPSAEKMRNLGKIDYKSIIKEDLLIPLSQSSMKSKTFKSNVKKKFTVLENLEEEKEKSQDSFVSSKFSSASFKNSRGFNEDAIISEKPVSQASKVRGADHNLLRRVKTLNRKKSGKHNILMGSSHYMPSSSKDQNEYQDRTVEFMDLREAS